MSMHRTKKRNRKDLSRYLPWIRAICWLFPRNRIYYHRPLLASINQLSEEPSPFLSFSSSSSLVCYISISFGESDSELDSEYDFLIGAVVPIGPSFFLPRFFLFLFLLIFIFKWGWGFVCWV